MISLAYCCRLVFSSTNAEGNVGICQTFLFFQTEKEKLFLEHFTCYLFSMNALFFMTACKQSKFIQIFQDMWELFVKRGLVSGIRLVFRDHVCLSMLHNFVLMSKPQGNQISGLKTEMLYVKSVFLSMHTLATCTAAAGSHDSTSTKLHLAEDRSLLVFALSQHHSDWTEPPEETLTSAMTSY